MDTESTETFRHLLGADTERCVRILLPLRDLDSGRLITWDRFATSAGRDGGVDGYARWSDLSRLETAGREPEGLLRCETAGGAVPAYILHQLAEILAPAEVDRWHGVSAGPAFAGDLSVRGSFREVTRFWPTRGLSGRLTRDDEGVVIAQVPYGDSLLVGTSDTLARALVGSDVEAFVVGADAEALLLTP